MPFLFLFMLTSSQQKALERSHHLSVTANAGSGKTKVLVERYVEILASGSASVGEVVAITFTEKAASELRRKIAERVMERIATSIDPVERQMLETVRRKLSAAVIGTIHSFCGRILREYPVEAGVDASFSVLEEIDRDLLLQESIRETFSSILKGEKNAVHSELYDVLRKLGKPGVLKIIKALVDKREVIERLTAKGGIYSGSDDEILAGWNDALQQHVQSELSADDLVKDVRRILGVATGLSAGAGKKLLDQFVTASSFAEKTELYERLMQLMLRQNSGLLKAFLGSGDEKIVAAEARSLHSRHRVISVFLNRIGAENTREEERELLRMTRCLLEVQRRILELYRRKKGVACQLDYDDLQLLTRALLQNEGVTQRLAQRYKFIMVDEYQDTNKLQYEILQPLLGRLSTGNLFIVGDPKQSIYAFRFADVAVFNQTKDDIIQKSGASGSVILDDSFRPLKKVAAFINTTFSPLMGGRIPAGSSTALYEIPYEPLVMARQNDADGRVEVLLRDEESADPELTEGEMIARRILQLHRSEYQVFDKEERSRNVRFKDIAILMRSRAPLASLESALVRYNIPYLTSGGVGYYQTQDIYDFYNYFQFLLNPDDDVALAGILRSPFFLVSDAELFELARERRSGSLWRHIRRTEMGRSAGVQHAAASLTADLDLGLRLPVPELISRVVQRTSYLGKVSGSSRSNQAIANLEKLQRLAQRYDVLGLTNLYDFTQRLKRLIDEEEKEGQGAVDVESDAVQVMTIHAAKGLEFPVVIIPNLEKSFRYDEEPYLDDRLGIGFSTHGDDGEEPSPLTALLRHQSRLKTRSEEKRIFYVGCTRARDMLILSASLKRGRNADGYMTWLQDSLGDDLSKGEFLEFPVSLSILKYQRGEFTQSDERFTLPVHLVRPAKLPAPPKFEQLSRSGEKLPSSYVGVIPSQSKGEIFSASKIKTYAECPSKYYLRYVLGLPDPVNVRRSILEDEESDEMLSGELRGIIVHEIMQRIDGIDLTPDSIRTEVEKRLVHFATEEGWKNSRALEEITGEIEAVIASECWKEVSRGRNAKTEFTITTAFGGDLLTGTIDRVYQDANGIWNVLDFKTDTVTVENLASRVKEYVPQLKFYALLVHRFFGVAPVRATILFTSMVNQPFAETYSIAALEGMEQEIDRVISRIKNREFSPKENPCEHCPLIPRGCPKY
jgi:ATP-dependent helicase/nuclease subunit A